MSRLMIQIVDQGQVGQDGVVVDQPVGKFAVEAFHLGDHFGRSGKDKV